MKKIYFLLMTILIAATGWSKTTTWTGGVNSNWDNAGNWDNGVPAANDVVIFPTNFTTAITRVAQAGDITLNSFEVQGNSSIRLVNTVARTITIANGPAFHDLAVAGAAQLTLGTNINLTLASGSPGNPTAAGIDGDLIIEPGRTYDTDNADVETDVDGLVQNSGTVAGVAGRLFFNAGSVYTHAENSGSIPLATWNSTSTASVTGIINVGPANLNQTFGNFTWNCPSQAINFNFGGVLTTINGDFAVANTGATGSIRLKNFEAGTATTTVAGDYIQTGGKLFLIGTSENQNLNIKGDFLMSGGTLTRGGTPGPTSIANVNFSGTAVQAFTKTAGTISNAINFTINNNAKVDFGTSVLSGSTGTFTLSTGGKIITASSDGLGAAGSIQMTRVYNSLAEYEFQGAGTGVFTTTTPNSVRDLTINNFANGGDISLDMPLTVSRNLTFVEGTITTTTNLLTIGTAGAATAPTPTSFVNGPLAKTGTTAFTFPVGKAGEGYRTIGIGTPSGNATFRAEFFRSNPSPGTLGGGMTQISACEYWDLTRTGGGAGINARVILSWESVSPCGSSPVYVTNPTTLVVAHLVGGTWNNEGRSSSTGNSTAGTVTSQNSVATFSPFTLGSISFLDNPLPVLFANVKAYEKNDGVQIEWSNMTEKDVANYVVERSANGSDFSAISQQLPTSNQNDKVDYSAFDANPLQAINYYRIKAIETTGKIVYSKILSVTIGTTSQSLRLYPNPVRGNQVNISMSNIKRGQYTLRIINTIGQDIFRQTINNQSSNMTQILDLPASIKAGVYKMVITGSDYRETKTFIVQ
ncbi:MAG: T9SS type A sorting domain-containing protein [Chitinophagaceae bacterium]